jgi:hypothetical protein
VGGAGAFLGVLAVDFGAATFFCSGVSGSVIAKLRKEKENALTGGPVRASGSLSDWTIAGGTKSPGVRQGRKMGFSYWE